MPTVAIIVMNRDRPEITDRVVEQISLLGCRSDIQKTLIVIEAGSKRQSGCSQYMTHWFSDPKYRGRYFAFNEGLKRAAELGEFDYYWFVVNDIEFSEEQDCLTELIECMEEEPQIGLIGPCELEADDYRGAAPQPEKRRWHKAATVHGLAHLIRGEVIQNIGYMNPAFHYSQGAGSEYSYKLYSNGWWMAYADRVTVTHDKSGSTYGKVVPISRHEYQRRANKFASQYLRKKYGADWDIRFANALPDDIECVTFQWQKEVWSKSLRKNWREVCPAIWRLGSRLKRLLGMSRGPIQ
ncbi:MAG: family 2 glycosyl transferase [Planctomycetaceae bacterium]|nr:family 2 glycosyl transferase [Planctomycetaceae bacterium]